MQCILKMEKLAPQSTCMSRPSYYAWCGLNAINTVNYSFSETGDVNNAPTQTSKYYFPRVPPSEVTWYFALKIANKHWISSEAIIQSQGSLKSHLLCLLFLMALATSCISTAASLSSKISKAGELSQASLSLLLSLSASLCMSMRIFAVFFHKTYEFVSFVWDKMKQTELGEVIGTLRQERGEKGEEWGRKRMQLD